MAWTAPRTWVAGELVTAALVNVHVRDNELAIGPHLIARKTADESTSSTTLQNDDHLLTPTIPLNEVWLLEWALTAVSAAGAFKLAVTFPSGTFSGAITGVSGDLFVSGNGTVTNTQTASSNTATDGMAHRLRGVFTCGGTGGVATLQWASSAGTNVTMKANSTLWGVKLA